MTFGLAGERPREGAHRRGGHINIPPEHIQEKKIEADPNVDYDRTLKRILLEFGNELLAAKSGTLAVPTIFEMMLKKYDTKDLLAEINKTDRKKWQQQWENREVFFKAVVDEIQLRLWEVRNKSKWSKNKSADVLKIK